MTDHTLLPAKAGITVPGPPSVVGSATIDSSFTCDGDVSSLEGIDARREVEALQSFPRRLDDRIELWLEHKLQHSTLLDNEVYATLQLDGSCQKLLSCWHNHSSATLLRALVDGLLDGLLIRGCWGINLRTILGDGEGLVSKLRLADALFNLPVLLLVPTLA